MPSPSFLPPYAQLEFEFASSVSLSHMPSPSFIPPYAQLEFVVARCLFVSCMCPYKLYKAGGRPSLVGDELSDHGTTGGHTTCKLRGANQYGPTKIRL